MRAADEAEAEAAEEESKEWPAGLRRVFLLHSSSSFPPACLHGTHTGSRPVSTKFALILLPETFAICRLEPKAAIPDWAHGELVSITRTREELSIVCCQEQTPADVVSEAGWRCLRLAGKFDLAEIGVLASLTRLLAEAKVSVFVVGTFDTDYVLVRQPHLQTAVEVLQHAGHSVRRLQP